jgi:hypothetical protein
MNTCARAFDKFILRVLAQPSADSERERNNAERGTVELRPKDPATPID